MLFLFFGMVVHVYIKKKLVEHGLFTEKKNNKRLFFTHIPHIETFIKFVVFMVLW